MLIHFPQETNKIHTKPSRLLLKISTAILCWVLWKPDTKLPDLHRTRVVQMSTTSSTFHEVKTKQTYPTRRDASLFKHFW